MKKEEFAYIGCKLLALYWLISALNLLATSVTTVSMLQYTESVSYFSTVAIYFSHLPLAVNIIFAIFFWFGANRLVKNIFSNANETNDSCITAHQVQIIAFSVVGLLLIVWSVPEIINLLYKIQLLKEFDSYSETPFSVKAKMVELILKSLLGILLFFGAKGLSGLLLRIRTLGSK